MHVAARLLVRVSPLQSSLSSLSLAAAAIDHRRAASTNPRTARRTCSSRCVDLIGRPPGQGKVHARARHPTTVAVSSFVGPRARPVIVSERLPTSRSETCQRVHLLTLASMATQSSWRSPNVAAATAAAAGAGASSGHGNTNTSTNTASTPRWGPGAQRNAHAPSPGQAPLQAQQANTGMSNGSSASPAAPSGASTAGTKDSADAVQRDRIMFLLVGLVGNTIVAHTRAGEKYVGILTSTSTPEGAAGVGIVLSCAQLVGKDESVGPLKKSLIIKADELDSFHARDVGLDVPVSTAKTSNAGRSGACGEGAGAGESETSPSLKADLGIASCACAQQASAPTLRSPNPPLTP